MPDLFDINKFQGLYRRKVRGLGVQQQAVRLDLDRVPAKTLRVLTHVTVENTEQSYDLLRIGINAGGIIHYLDELTDPAEAELAVSRSDILLGENDVFFAELTGTGDDDPLIMTCIGWEQSLK